MLVNEGGDRYARSHLVDFYPRDGVIKNCSAAGWGEEAREPGRRSASNSGALNRLRKETCWQRPGVVSENRGTVGENRMIVVENHGPLILSSNFWGSDYEAAGKLYVSLNAGAVRVLVPRSQRAVIEEMRPAREVVLSRGPWPERGLAEAVELLFDDGSDNPFALHLSPESFDLLPGEPEPGRSWVLTVWDEKKGRPHQCLQRACHWRQWTRFLASEPWRSNG